VHFILNQTNATSGLLSAVFSTDSFTDEPDTPSNSDNLHWHVVITGDLNTTITSATTDAAGGNLVLSHVCPGGGTEETEAPSFEQSQEGETDAPSDAPSFEQSQEGATEPSTDAFGTNGTSGPADGAWLLVVALGVLLGSVVVLTPARAKSRR
jgi:hypothetical protein